MSYSLFDQDENEIILRDLQDKAPWCADGASREFNFIKKYGQNFNLLINPEKENNVYAIDLINSQTGRLADLKTQNTPFFKSSDLYGIDPTYAVTFNVNDFTRYKSDYPDIDIFFWVDWLAVKFVGNKTIRVHPLKGIWRISFEEILKIAGKYPIHRYQQRVHDMKGNSKDSFVFDLRDNSFEKLA